MFGIIGLALIILLGIVLTGYHEFRKWWTHTMLIWIIAASMNLSVWWHSLKEIR